MELTLAYTIVGFALAGWSVIANDSIQTLGTFIASKQKLFKWYTLATSASLAMIVTIIATEAVLARVYHLNHLCLEAINVPKV